MSRRFSRISQEQAAKDGILNVTEDSVIPYRATRYSAGYDLFSASSVILSPHQTTMIPTGIKVYMEEDDVFLLFSRSGFSTKNNLWLTNSVGVIDADYVDNDSNEGHFFVPIFNANDYSIKVPKKSKIAQGIFTKFLLVEGDHVVNRRSGGFDSTGPS